ncbi:hypothetical protein C8255_07760 [filamentous cyanobacterium CCP3]|nr:hypothetical protein C8255_07760 [filamentous cyanobacterium CCP3]
MDSLAQNLLWLVWETGLEPQPDPPPAIAPMNRGRWLTHAVAIAAGATVLSSSWATPAAADGGWGSTVYVATPVGYALNKRWGPGTNYGIYEKVRRGSALQVSGDRRNGWVELVDGTWVAGNLVSASSVGQVPVEPPLIDDRTLATVITPPNFGLNVRSGPGREYPIVRQFVNGSRIPLTGRFNVGWAQLTNGNWVDSSHLQYSGPKYEVSPDRPSEDSKPQMLPAEVMEVQRRLQQLGYLPANLAVTGIYDQTTQNAVRDFQRVNRLPVTGNVDDATRQALYRATIPDSNVMQVQRQLKQLGYLPANFAITGIYDQTTQKAVRDFQRVNGLPATGTADEATRQALNNATIPNPLPSPSPSPSPDPTTSPPVGSSQRRVITDGSSTPVYAGPGNEFDFVRSVPNGSIVNITGNTSGNWSELSDGNWIFSLWLEPL